LFVVIIMYYLFLFHYVKIVINIKSEVAREKHNLLPTDFNSFMLQN